MWLDRAEHIGALLDGAGELDRAARRDRQHIPRKALLSTLVFAGLRIGELLDLRWRDVDLTAGRITVRASKTDAGVRQVDMLSVLRDELLELKAAARRTQPNDPVFGTSHAKRQHASNIRNRVLAPAVKRANERRDDAGEVPLPERLTPHKLRHTFASLLVALGVDPALRHGSTRPHRSGVHVAGLPARDAPRPGVEGRAARARWRQGLGSPGSKVIPVRFAHASEASLNEENPAMSSAFRSAPGRI